MLPISWDATTGDRWIEAISENTPVQISSGKTEYLSWYDWPVALITEENKDEIIMMTGEELLYRNEIYWFQVKLGKAWKGARIYEEILEEVDEKSGHSQLLNFEMPSPFRPEEYEFIIGISVLNYEDHQKTREQIKNHVFYQLEDFDIDTKWNNNKYYFRFLRTNRLHEELYEIFYPHLECKDIFKDWFIIKTCEEGLIDLFSDWEVFDVQ